MRIAKQGTPTANLVARVDIETDARRRRIQQETGWSTPRLVAEALLALEPRILATARRNQQPEAAAE